MTVAVPSLDLRQLALTCAPLRDRKPSGHHVFTPEPQGDRTFVTLLSLNFMLLAFFIVLGVGASVDKPRARTIAANVRIAFSRSDEDIKPRVTILTARQALQAGVSDALADILPELPHFYVDNSDRIDVDVPESVLIGDAERDSVADNIAHLLQTAPAGFRYALLIAGGDETSTSGKAAAAFAGNLVSHGVAPQDILVGSSATEPEKLHLSFLVFEGEVDDDGEPWSTGILAPAPRKAQFSTPIEQPAEQVSPDQPTGETQP